MIQYKSDSPHTAQLNVECQQSNQIGLSDLYRNRCRPNKGLTFHCECCHLELHADLIAARNITLRTLLSRQDWERTGELSVRPDVSSREAKAERLSRYSGLRWSSDTSPRYTEG